MISNFAPLFNAVLAVRSVAPGAFFGIVDELKAYLTDEVVLHAFADDYGVLGFFSNYLPGRQLL